MNNLHYYNSNTLVTSQPRLLRLANMPTTVTPASMGDGR